MVPRVALAGLLSLVTLAKAATDTCAHDNCYRNALSGVSYTADCSRVLVCTTTGSVTTVTATVTSTPSATTVTSTVTPSSVTVTATSSPATTTTVTPTSTVLITVTPTTTVTQFQKRGELEKRTTTSSDGCKRSPVPAYAAACSGFARYSSACSCAGITASTVSVTGLTFLKYSTSTLSQATSTSTVTLTASTTTASTTLATATVTVTAAATTTTSTVTAASSTVTVTTTPPTPSQCNNAGVQFAYFADNQAAATFDPTVNKQVTPALTGTTQYLSYHANAGTVYGTAEPTTHFTIEHRGYIFAPETGTYTFAASAVHNNLYAWFGSTAYSGWTAANSIQNIASTTKPATDGAGSTTVTMQQGNYYPFRVVFHVDTGNGGFKYSITAPSGRVVITSDATSTAPYVVQFSCDGTSAPAYPPFGAET